MRSNSGKNIKLKTGKSNLDIIRSYINGERAFVQVGYDENVGLSSRKEGEEWEDGNGTRWVKKNGVRCKINKHAKIIIEQRCSICNADMKWGNYLDQKIYPKTTRCYDCNIEFEGILKARGLYGDYEKFKMINNEMSMMKDFRGKVVDSITFLENYTPQTKDLQFFNEDGSNEIWVDNTDRREIVLRDLKADLEKVNSGIALAEDELKKLSYDSSIEPTIKKETLKRLAEKEKAENG